MRSWWRSAVRWWRGRQIIECERCFGAGAVQVTVTVLDPPAVVWNRCVMCAGSGAHRRDAFLG